MGDRRGSARKAGRRLGPAAAVNDRSDEVGTSVPAPACGASATRPTSGVGGDRPRPQQHPATAPAGRGTSAADERELNEAMAGQKIRIRLKSYDHEVIDSSARKIVDTVTRAGATVVGPVPLPTEKNVYCVIRSPHKYKDSREHFEMRTHKRLIDIIDPTPKAVDSLMRLDLPADVNIEIKL